jgi:TonB family protein
MKLVLKMLGVVVFAFSSLYAQRSDTEAGVELYQKHDYPAAVSLLKKAIKTDKNDSRAWFYLGMSYLGSKKEKDAQKAVEHAIALNPDSDLFHTGLAYVYLQRGNERSRNEADKALKLNAKNAEAVYIIGANYYRNESYNSAYEKASEAIALNPSFAAAYLLKSQTLVSSFMLQGTTVVRPPEARYALLKEASEDLNRYLQLTPDGTTKQEQKDYLESLYFFTNYYKAPDNMKTADGDAVPRTNSTPISILSKPKPSYTDNARAAGAQGTVRMLIAFDGNGKIGHILITKRLGFGLDEQALRAARAIKFLPASQDGKPVSVVKTVEYSFGIY